MQRCCDVLLAGTALLCFSPLLLAVMLVLRISGDRRVLCRQCWIGLAGKPYETLSLARIRRGAIARSPQLIKVISGDMSLVGPSPISPERYELMSPLQKRRMTAVRPGCMNVGTFICRGTGLSSNGHVDCHFRMIHGYFEALDVWHVENNDVTTYLLVLLCVLATFVLPGYRVVWRLFPDLPKPPALIQRVA